MRRIVGTPNGETVVDKPINKQDVEELMQTVRELYCADEIPWVIGYSGGKDSSATLQLVWIALENLPVEKLQKPVHIIYTDTQVESPIVERWAANSLRKMEEMANRRHLPFRAHRLTPKPDQTYWVNLIGRGYPFPRKKYRWCTDRLKIQPVNDFIKERISQYGEIILVLGTRKAESARRARTMEKYEAQQVRDLLSPNPNLVNELVYSPLAEWSNDDVWLFLMQYKNPWGYSNNDLLTLYKGATADNECPLMVEKGLPSCGKSRFGCWMCTMVSEDKSMQAMIANDDEKRWLTPLLEFRNEIGDESEDLSRRSFRKMNGSLQGTDEKIFHGPYNREVRNEWLRKLLTLQEHVRAICPPEYRDLELITESELRQIRRIWVIEKHEFEDSVPRIYKEVTGNEFKDDEWVAPNGLTSSDWDLLEGVVERAQPDEQLAFELVYTLLDIEARAISSNKRAGIFDQLESAISKNFYSNEDDALAYFQKKRLRSSASPIELERPDEYEEQ